MSDENFNPQAPRDSAAPASEPLDGADEREESPVQRSALPQFTRPGAARAASEAAGQERPGPQRPPAAPAAAATEEGEEGASGSEDSERAAGASFTGEASAPRDDEDRDTPLAQGEEGAASGGAAPASEEDDDDADYRRRLREFTRELKKQPGDWYIIQSYAGYENKVKTNLEMRARTLEVEDEIYDVVVPVEQAVEIKDGKRKLVKRKLLPGYVLVRMDMSDRVWSVVRETPGVTSFVGNSGEATKVKHRDVAKFLMPKVEPDQARGEKAAGDDQVVAMPEEKEKPQQHIDVEVGEAVTILTGALASVSATVSAIDYETGKIQALVSIFGRETPVELTADQVEKII